RRPDATRSSSAAPTIRCSPAPSPTSPATASRWCPARTRRPRTSTASSTTAAWRPAARPPPGTASAPPATPRSSPGSDAASWVRRSTRSKSLQWGVPPSWEARMKVTIIGCSGSFPGPDSPASCYLVEAEGFRLLLDFGSGSLGVLQRFIGLYDVDAIFLSHLHADHSRDLCGYHVARTYGPAPPYPPLPAHAPADAPRRPPAPRRTPAPPGLETASAFARLAPGTIEAGPFRVTSALVNHPVEAYGFRVEYGGRSVTYSGDTGECPELVKLAENTDLLLCEASLLHRP